jgi:hypothetical protein
LYRRSRLKPEVGHPGSTLAIDKPGGATNQQWKLVPVGDNQVYIASALDNNLVLDLRGGGAAPHTLIQLYNVGDKKPNQIWYLSPT